MAREYSQDGEADALVVEDAALFLKRKGFRDSRYHSDD
jgi:hypothetical protein